MSTSRLSLRTVSVVVLLMAAVLVGVVPPPARAAGGAWQVTDRLALSATRIATACGSATNCWAVTGGELLQSSDNGGSWADRTALVPTGIRGLSDVSCPTASRCVVSAFTGAGALLLVVDGTSVTQRPVTGAPGAPVSLSCATASRCLVTDGVSAFRTGNGGLTWSTSTLPRTMPDRVAVSCVAGGSVCAVAGTRGGFSPVPAAARTPDGGATWQSLTIPAGHRSNAQLDDVACSTAALCRLVGHSGSHTLMLATTSATAPDTAVVPLPASLYEISSLSCPSSTSCTGYAQGANSDQREVRTTDGAHWTSTRIDPGYAFDRVDLACVTGDRCVAVTLGLTRTRAADGTWRTVTVPAAIRAVADLSCADVLPCVGIGVDAANRAVAVHGRPGAWAVTRMPASIDEVDGLDCATSSVCTALTAYRRAHDPSTYRRAWRTVDSGVTWTAQTIPDPAGFNTDIDCPSTTTCLATGFTPRYEPDLLRTVDGGLTWTHVPPPHGARDVRAVACAAASSCVVSGHPDFGTPPSFWRTVNAGTTFSAGTSIGRDGDSFWDLACQATVCLASGYVRGVSALVRSTDSGRTWSVSPAPVDTMSATTALTCSRGGRCAVLAAPRAQAYLPVVSTDGGATWHAGAFPPGAGSLGPVACLDDGCISIGYDRARLPIVLVEPS